MTKLGTLITKLRKDERKFALFLHDLAHELSPDEAEIIHQHSHEVHDNDVKTVLDSVETPDVDREGMLAQQLEELVGKLRSGEYKLDPRAIGVDVKIEHVYEESK